MTELHEKALMIANSLLYYTKGALTPQECHNEFEWLKNYSTIGIEMWLHEAEKKGYVRSVDKDNKVAYLCNKKQTQKAIDKYF